MILEITIQRTIIETKVRVRNCIDFYKIYQTYITVYHFGKIFHFSVSSIIADDDNDSIAERNPNDRGDPMDTDEKQCPLCQENFRSQDTLNEHALSVHSVNAEGLARLQSLINGSHWLANKKNEKENSKEEGDPTNQSSEGKGKNHHYQMIK